MSEIDSSSEIGDLMNPTDELKKKIVAVASTIREWNNETARVRKTVKKQFEEIRNLGLNKYKMENAALRKLVEDIFRIHGVSDSWLRKLLPVELKDTKKTRLSYLQKQEIEKEQRLLLSQQPHPSESHQKSESKEYNHHYSCTADPASYQSVEQELTLSSSNIQQGSETRHALENDSLDHEALSLPSRESVTIQNEQNEQNKANKRIEKLEEGIRWLSEPFVAKAYLQNEYQDIPLVAQIDPVKKVIISIQIDKSY